MIRLLKYSFKQSLLMNVLLFIFNGAGISILAYLISKGHGEITPIMAVFFIVVSIMLIGMGAYMAITNEIKGDGSILFLIPISGVRIFLSKILFIVFQLILFLMPYFFLLNGLSGEALIEPSGGFLIYYMWNPTTVVSYIIYLVFITLVLTGVLYERFVELSVKNKKMNRVKFFFQDLFSVLGVILIIYVLNGLDQYFSISIAVLISVVVMGAMIIGIIYLAGRYIDKYLDI